MTKKFVIAWAAVFVVWMAGSFVVHGLLLRADYLRVPGLFRSEADSQPYFPLMILAHVVLAGAFVWIYTRGAEARPWLGQGLRFGLAVALLTVIPMYTIYYVVQPLPLALVVKQIVFDSALLLVLGGVVAFVARRP
jgi:hypothetical protein